MVLGTLLSRALIISLGYALPAYQSYKVVKLLETRQLSPEEAFGLLEKWIKYWIVMGVFCAVEFFGDTFVFWFPLYYEFKVLLFLWLTIPYTKGAELVYIGYVQPYLQRNEREFDAKLEEWSTVGKEAFKRYGELWIKAAYQFLVHAVLSLHSMSTGKVNPASIVGESSASSSPSRKVSYDVDDDARITQAPVARSRAQSQQPTSSTLYPSLDTKPRKLSQESPAYIAEEIFTSLKETELSDQDNDIVLLSSVASSSPGNKNARAKMRQRKQGKPSSDPPSLLPKASSGVDSALKALESEPMDYEADFDNLLNVGVGSKPSILPGIPRNRDR